MEYLKTTGQMYGTFPLICGGLTWGTFHCDCYAFKNGSWVEKPSLPQCVLAATTLVVTQNEKVYHIYTAHQTKLNCKQKNFYNKIFVIQSTFSLFLPF
jgi:hypothetical protein